MDIKPEEFTNKITLEIINLMYFLLETHAFHETSELHMAKHENKEVFYIESSIDDIKEKTVISIEEINKNNHEIQIDFISNKNKISTKSNYNPESFFLINCRINNWKDKFKHGKIN